jgi:hypothetical protein
MNEVKNSQESSHSQSSGSIRRKNLEIQAQALKTQGDASIVVSGKVYSSNLTKDFRLEFYD